MSYSKAEIKQFASEVFSVVEQTLVDGEVITWDFALGSSADVTLGGNRVLQVINADNGDSGILYVYQDGTGNRTLSLPGNKPSLFALSIGAGEQDIVGFNRKFSTFNWSIEKFGAVPDPSIAAPVLGTPSSTVDGIYIYLPFDKAMLTPSGKYAQFSYTIDGVTHSFLASELKSGDNTKIQLTASTNIVYGNVVTISYTPGDIISSDGGIATAFSGVGVTNNVPAATTDIPEPAEWNLIIDPRSTANLVLSGTNVLNIKDTSGAGAGRQTSGGGGLMQYDATEKFLNFVTAGSATYLSFPAIITLPTNWAIVMVFRMNSTGAPTIMSSVAGGNFMQFVTGSAGSGVVHQGLNMNTTIIVPTSSGAANQRFTNLSTKYRVIITKTGSVIKYMINGTSYTAAATSIVRDYFQRFSLNTPVGPDLFFLGFRTYVADADRAALDTFLQTF